MQRVELPAGLSQQSNEQAILDDLAPYRGTSVEERSSILSMLCRYAAEQIAAHPEGKRILAYRDRRTPESLETWCRLGARHRKGT